nr:uncharacterized protein LOC133616102 [Nerophis lumbriciformis]
MERAATPQTCNLRQRMRSCQKKRSRKPVHRLGDSDDSEEDPGNSDLASLGSASQLHRQTPPSRRVPARVVSTCQLDSSTGDNFLAPHHGEGRTHMPSPAPALNMQRVTQGTAVPPRLPPPHAPPLNMWQTQEPGSSLAYRPTWRGGRMADNIPCSAAEVHILSLLENIKHTQDQLMAKSSSLATIGGHNVKRVTWNILGRMFTDEVSHQINWKGVNNKKAFSRMATKTLLFSKYIIQSNITYVQSQ